MARRAPSLNRDLAWIGAGILAAAAAVGAAVAFVFDHVYWHRRA